MIAPRNAQVAGCVQVQTRIVACRYGKLRLMHRQDIQAAP